jgi:hypothetical protein
MRVACSLLAVTLSWPAIAEAQPAFGPELGTGVYTTVGFATPGPGFVAFDGTTYLIAWSDWRHVLAARVRASDGAVLDPIALEIGSTVETLGSPTVSYDGTTFVVAWNDDSLVHAARVGADGTILDPGGIELGAGWFATVACVPGECLVGWTGYPDYQAEIVRISGGEVLDLKPRSLGAADRLALAANDADFLAAWETGTSIVASRVASDGTIQDPGGLAVGIGNERGLTAASDGADYLVTWNGFPTLLGARVGADGIVRDPGGFALSGAGSPDWFSAVFDGARYELFYGDTSVDDFGLFEEAVDPTSAAVTVIGNPSPWTQRWLAAAPGLLVQDVGAQRVRSDGSILDATPIGFARSASNQTDVDVAPGAIVWTDDRVDAPGVYFSRLDPDTGAALDGGGRFLAATGRMPSVACADDACLIAWSDLPTYEILGARVRRSDGLLLDPVPIIISDVPDENIWPSIAFDGTDYLVAWSDSQWMRYPDGTMFPTFPLAAARVRASDGAVLDPTPIPIPGGGMPRVGSNGAGFLVGSADYVVLASSVGSDGVVGPLYELGTYAGGQTDPPAIAWDGADYLVGWASYQGAQLTRLRPSDLSVDGTIETLWSGVGSASDMSVACDGSDCLAAWETVDEDLVIPDATFALRWTRLGDPTPTTPILEGDGLDTERGLRVAVAGPGAFVAAYHRVDEGPAFESSRARWRRVSFAAIAAPDAGVAAPDAGRVAGPPDAATAAQPDAGGSHEQPPGEASSGCGCRVGATGSTSRSIIMLLGMLAVIRRRGRRGRRG